MREKKTPRKSLSRIDASRRVAHASVAARVLAGGGVRVSLSLSISIYLSQSLYLSLSNLSCLVVTLVVAFLDARRHSPTRWPPRARESHACGACFIRQYPPKAHQRTRHQLWLTLRARSSVRRRESRSASSTKLEFARYSYCRLRANSSAIAPRERPRPAVH